MCMCDAPIVEEVGDCAKIYHGYQLSQKFVCIICINLNLMAQILCMRNSTTERQEKNLVAIPIPVLQDSLYECSAWWSEPF